MVSRAATSGATRKEEHLSATSVGQTQWKVAKKVNSLEPL